MLTHCLDKPDGIKAYWYMYLSNLDFFFLSKQFYKQNLLSRKMVFSSKYTKQRILSLHWQGFKVSAIVECLVLEDRIRILKQGFCQFLKHYKLTGTIARKQGSGPSARLSPEIQEILGDAMHQDDETTPTQLQAKLAS